ncbi:MAG: dihydrodipicolinate synthase family protein [Acidobacteriota bacterium]|nr:dihydrodipicolinate synthase family protein [Acidobacteriota bacterium]
MKTTPVGPQDLCGVFAVPPLARKPDATRSLDVEQNNLIVRHIVNGGITRLLYGGNAFLYHITLAEYEKLLNWLADLANDVWVIPSIGPSYGRAMDQAALLRRHEFPCVMMLPCGDPRDAHGLEQGFREIADASNAKLIVYLKEENNFGPDKDAGLDAVARLIADGVCIGIKYAVVRQDPTQDGYLEALLKRVDRKFVISGIGERPAVVHMRDWKLPGFTTGSGCIAPRLSQLLFEACAAGGFKTAESFRARFIELEDLRDQWGQARVLHCATQLAGIARMGAVQPYGSALSVEQEQELAPVVTRLMEIERSDSSCRASGD